MIGGRGKWGACFTENDLEINPQQLMQFIQAEYVKMTGKTPHNVPFTKEMMKLTRPTAGAEELLEEQPNSLR